MQRLDAEMYLEHGFTVHGEWFVNRKRIPRYLLRAPTDEDETTEEPGSADAEHRKEATIGKRALMYFPPPLNDHPLPSPRACGCRRRGGAAAS
jgi:hypothetical protein